MPKRMPVERGAGEVEVWRMKGAVQLTMRSIRQAIHRHDEESWKTPELHELWLMAGDFRWAFSTVAPVDAAQLWLVVDRAVQMGFAGRDDVERLRVAGW
jgi:hypothetical protein